ncbi:hypothetical protein [Mycobacterium sp.]|uniref:hypothetical protein n=1 Tax=Mycobacterium sp. TaxID=1785 RepID=UPI002B57AB95|nr:hypothetical protein [Mycobacterium sp.]HTY30117.1 hypothetical protein [Mycobacterium sp.]
MLNTAVMPPMSTAPALGRCWLHNTVNGANAADAQTTAMIRCAARNRPRWDRNALIHSYLSGLLRQPTGRDIRQQTSERSAAVRSARS